MMTQPDTPISPETVVPALTQAVGQLLRRLRADANPDSLNYSQTGALNRLAVTGGMTNAELARAELMKPQSMGAILAGLEQEGLVARAPHPTDGRQILFSLTARGTQARQRRSAAKQDWLIAAVTKLDAEEQATLMAATSLIRRLNAS